MTDNITDIHGKKVFHFPPDGYPIASEREATDVIGEVWVDWPDIAAIPVERFPEDFFRLETTVAGAITQKFANYGLHVALVGDISEHTARSSALTSYVHESNRGRHVWFVNDLDELAKRLRPRP